MKRNLWKNATLLASLLCMPLLLQRADAVTVDFSAGSGCGGPVTGPSVLLSRHCSTGSADSIFTEYDVEASATDVLGQGSLGISGFTSESFDGLRRAFGSISADADGLLSILTPVPAVDITFSIDCSGVSPFGGGCGRTLTLGGKSSHVEGAGIADVTISDVPSHIPLPYELSVVAVIDTEEGVFGSSTFSFDAGFNYDLRNALIQDHETGAILEGAAVRIVPEPATGALIGIGLLAVALAGNRARHARQWVAGIRSLGGPAPDPA